MEQEELAQVAERVCKDCGAALGAGREDRQYCDDGCRTNFNNRKRRERQKAVSPVPETAKPSLTIPEYITRIQEILLDNRAIMESLCDEDKPRRMRFRDLIGKGFNAKYFTSETEPTGTGNIYRFCFEYGYRRDDEGMVVIICRKREVL
ncbi:MAG: hypothetical protein M3O71_21140 [Bacteroidota bacterium]|nr:hypothetical protein [Bacteroidota bacterium]